MKFKAKPTAPRSPKEAGIVIVEKPYHVSALISGDLYAPMRLYCTINRTSAKELIEKHFTELVGDLKKTHPHLFDVRVARET